jgi:hypothetical protein
MLYHNGIAANCGSPQIKYTIPGDCILSLIRMAVGIYDSQNFEPKQLKMALKGHWHEKFCLWFFPSEHVPQPPDSYPKAISNINLNSLKNLNFQSILRCGPPQKIDLFL